VGKFGIFLTGWRIIYKNISLSNFFSFFRAIPFAIEKKKDILLPKLVPKRSFFMPTKKRGYSFIQQYTSVILVFVLFLSQSIQVSFFDTTEAATTDYRDIVSIIVDEDTYSALRPKIRLYAEDIQNTLKSTRVSIFVAPQNARPEVIAAHNEELYYE
jgi:hypothetical protein